MRLCVIIQLSFKIFCRKTSLKMGRFLCYRGGLSFWCYKINKFQGTNPRVVNGQRIKHYISGNPINVEINIIETITPEEYIRDTFQNVTDSEKV